MFVACDSRPSPRCWTNWCQSQLWRRAPVERTMSEAERIHVYTNPLTQVEEVRWAPQGKRPVCRPQTWPEEHQSDLILKPTNGQRRQIKKQNGSFFVCVDSGRGCSRTQYVEMMLQFCSSSEPPQLLFSFIKYIIDFDYVKHEAWCK